jgi:oligoribonuclease
MLIWVDIETTGLDARSDRILEIGMVQTTDELEVVEYRTKYLTLQVEGKPVQRWDPVVAEMHKNSGLIRDCAFSQNSLADAEREFTNFIANCVEPDPPTGGVRPMEAGQHPMCGSSVHFDRAFLKRWLPNIEAWFHYRNIDVSSIGELAKLWDPVIWENRPEDMKVHRVIPDIQDSIRRLRWFVETGFIRPIWMQDRQLISPYMGLTTMQSEVNDEQHDMG